VPYRKLHTKFADILIKYGGRPHWAKEHELRPKEIEALYPDFHKFREVLERVDPEGVMRSEYVRRHIDGEEEIGARVFKVRK
jgi:L-gulonolactone oxidase